MKKGELYEGTIESVRFPNKGMITQASRVSGAEDGAARSEAEDEPARSAAEHCRVTVKNTIPGQQVRFRVRRCKGGAAEGQLLIVTKRSPLELDEPACPHADFCGGCSYQTLPYGEQLRLKEEQVLALVGEVLPDAKGRYTGIRPSPQQFGYRNKMEFTFGDAEKDGPLTLGLHRRDSRYDIVFVKDCQIVDADFREILAATREYFRGAGVPYYHRVRHDGWLRHLVVRKAAHTGEILIDLVTATKIENSVTITDGEEDLLSGWCARLRALPLDGEIAGILHTHNDSPGDVVLDEGTDILYGRDFFYEELLGLTFRITPFAFFQTNSRGAEVLYRTAREMIAGADGGGSAGKIVYDLYSGTGTIAQMLSPAAEKVVGVEIVPEAVAAARENAARNGLTNCTFLAGDVLRVLDDLTEQPDLIVLDPPRDGVHPKALQKILDFGAERILYISCKPTSLKRDLLILLQSGYRVEQFGCVDLFPGTVHVETLAMLRRGAGAQGCSDESL